jgi:hypothetical protein
MNDTEALDILRAQGCTVGTLDVQTGRVRLWFPGGEEAVDVIVGTELHDLAAGRLTAEEILSRREDEIVDRTD